MRFHFDSYLLTVLVPISIPSEGAPGHLLMFPSMRSVRSSYLHSMWDKLWIDVPSAQRRFAAAARRRERAVAIRMVPGDAYLFWGYRSLHTNEGCDPGVLRATALMHFGDPHADSRWRSLVRRLRRLKAA